jgi:hypothetical protein
MTIGPWSPMPWQRLLQTAGPCRALDRVSAGIAAGAGPHRPQDPGGGLGLGVIVRKGASVDGIRCHGPPFRQAWAASDGLRVLHPISIHGLSSSRALIPPSKPSGRANTQSRSFSNSVGRVSPVQTSAPIDSNHGDAAARGSSSYSIFLSWYGRLFDLRPMNQP